VYTEISHRLKKPQSQDLEEQVTPVDPVEVVWTVLDEAVQFSLDPVALVFFNKFHSMSFGIWPLSFSSSLFNETRLYGFKVINIGTCCASYECHAEANSS
jgi:hypothetical protein